VRPPTQHLDAILEDGVRFLAVEGRVDSRAGASGQEEASLDLWMTWEDINPVGVPYGYVFGLADSETGAIQSTVSMAPFSGSYPMTCWKTEDGQLTERVRIALPQSALREWWVDFAVVDPSTGEAAAWIARDGLRRYSLRLGPFVP
jgi:hypothetical protein